MFLINVHELDVVFAQPVAFCAFEHKVDDIGRVFCLQRQDVFVLGAS